MPFWKYGGVGDSFGNPDEIDFRNIRAGAINAAQLTLVGASSLIQSSNFDDATAGWQIKGDGVAKFREIFADTGELGDLTITGTLTMGTGGIIRTATSGQRVEITEADKDSVRFFTGDSFETDPGWIRSVVSGAGDGLSVRTEIRAPTSTTGVDGGVFIVLRSETVDDSTGTHGVVFGSDSGSSQTGNVRLQNNLDLSLAGGSYIHSDGLGAVGDLVLGIGTSHDDGIYSPADSQLGFVIAGTEIFKLTSTGITGKAFAQWQLWTPTLTNITKGNGNIQSRYIQIGELIVAQFIFVLGSTSAMGTNGEVSAPVTMSSTADNFPIGVCSMIDSGGSLYLGTVLEVGGKFRPAAHVASATHVTATGTSATVPMTWASGDTLSFTVTYEAA